MKKLHRIKIEVPEGSKYARIMPFSDMHYGNRNHNRTAFNQFFKTALEEKDIYVIGNGDWIENAGKNNLGFHDQIISVDSQVKYIIKKFLPIAEEGRLIGFVRGNHELRSVKSDMMTDVAERISNGLGVEYMGDGAFLSLNVSNGSKGKNYTAYAVHGNSGARTVGGKMNACLKLADFVKADLYMHGHVHALDSRKGFVYDIMPQSVKELKPTFVLTGHFLHYLGSYAQQKTLRPSGPAGTPKIKLHIDMKRISVSL